MKGKYDQTKIKKLTVPNIARLDLLQHLGPDGSVNLLVLSNELGLELHDLGNTAASDGLAERLLPRPSRSLFRRLLLLLLLLLVRARCRLWGRGAWLPHVFFLLLFSSLVGFLWLW